MKESEMKKGMYVIINSTFKTSNTHSTTLKMKEMVNQVYQIENIQRTCHGDAALIDGYYWHPGDLTFEKSLSPIEKPKIYHFDIKELVI